MPSEIQAIDLLGGHVALDFVNTVHHRFEPEIRDYLHQFDDLVAWGVRVGLHSPRQSKSLTATATRHPDDASKVFQFAMGLREALHDTLIGIIQGNEPEAYITRFLTNAFTEACAHRRLGWDSGGLHWYWPSSAVNLAQAWWPIATEAAQLLTNHPLPLIKECPHPEGCGWLFMDHSKNRSRRWCSMKTCGNLAKVKRHYRKKRREGK